MRILLAHTSLSGNTRDVARAIHARCEEMGHVVTWIDADIQTLAKVCPDDATHDLYVLGSWSINAGRTPPEMKRFIEDLVTAVGKPDRVAVFGTGETQWGEEHYCGAARRIAAFFGTHYPRLEIEQMPHGEHDANKIQRWTDHILAVATQQIEIAPMQTLHASTPDDYAAALAAHPRLLVDYYKDDCPGCKMLDMSLAKFAADPASEGVTLLKVKMEIVGEDFFRGLGLRQTPTLALFKDGSEAARLPGFQAPGQISQAVGLHLAGAVA